MPQQVPGDVKRQRAGKLEKTAAAIKSRVLDEYVERHRKNPVFVLCEEPLDGLVYGHSEHYVDVLCDAEDTEILKIVPVVLDHHDGIRCYGKVLRP